MPHPLVATSNSSGDAVAGPLETQYLGSRL